MQWKQYVTEMTKDLKIYTLISILGNEKKKSKLKRKVSRRQEIKITAEINIIKLKTRNQQRKKATSLKILIRWVSFSRG